MALALFDRVQETTTTSGTGTVTLAGAVAGFQSFAVVGNGNTCYYTIVDGSAWEVGIGTYSTTGPTLARTTVLSNSDGNTSPITLSSNSKPVFLTYPAEKSVNLDASGNVSALGTVSSGTWQGSTVGVAYGGTGVTASSGANSVVLRDANQNIAVNSVTQAVASTVSAAGTTTLTVASPHFQILTGTTTQTFKLPDATLLDPGSSWVFDNDSTGNMTVTDHAGATIDVVAPGGYSTVFLEANGTVAGTWGKFGMIPSEVNWGTNNLDLGGSTTVTNGTWQGTPVAYNYGGTGLTTFTAANYALYSTSASALTAGTLPVAAGGTGQTSFTDGQLLIGNTTGNTLTKATLTQGTGITVTNGNGSITVANSLPMTYPGSGVAVSTGTAWGTSLVAASANTASALVQRDASGNFSAGTITATLSGSATQVSNSLTLATSGTGLSGSATFNGASAQTFTVTSNATNANTASTIVARDASGNFSAGTITATLSGTASNATTAGGLAVNSTGTNNVANQIMRTDSNGYANFGWINSVSGDNGTTTISRITASSDAYLRYYTPANFNKALNRSVFNRESSGGTMVAGNIYSIYTGGGALTMYLPTGANTAQGDQITIYNLLLQWGTYNFTVALNTNTRIMSLNENLVCNVNVGSIVLVCAYHDGTIAYWNVAPGG